MSPLGDILNCSHTVPLSSKLCNPVLTGLRPEKSYFNISLVYHRKESDTTSKYSFSAEGNKPPYPFPNPPLTASLFSFRYPLIPEDAIPST
jgi:hypothetical protein